MCNEFVLFLASEAAVKLEKIMLGTTIKKDIAMLSGDTHTGSIESFNSTILQWAPKHTAYGYVGMIAR